MPQPPAHQPPLLHPALATPRLCLRPFRLEDVEAMHACYGDAEAMRFWNRPAHRRRSETERVVRRSMAFTPKRRLVWAVAEAGSDRCIGMVNYHNADMKQRQAEIGYMIAPDWWGRGVASEAVGALLGYCFGVARFHRVQAVIDPENAASRRLVERFGFRLEGVLRETLFLGGAWRDDCVYGLLEGEWTGAAGA